MDVDHLDMDADNPDMNRQVEKSDLEDELQEGLGEVQDEGQASIENATVIHLEATVPKISNDSVPQISHKSVVFCVIYQCAELHHLQQEEWTQRRLKNRQHQLQDELLYRQLKNQLVPELHHMIAQCVWLIFPTQQ